MAALKVVADVGSKPDLSEFAPRPGPPPNRRWQQVIANLSVEDETKLRAALLEESIAPYAIGLWLEQRDLIVDPRTIKGWRRHRYATTA